MSANNAKTALAYCRIWHEVDASGKILGRLANQIARVLMGKHKPIYQPAADCGDYVVVKNMKEIALSGNKRLDKTYYYHTGYPGGIRSYKIGRLFKSFPDQILKKAVFGMLPRNRLRPARMNRLYVYQGPEHPLSANIFKSYVQEPIAPIFPLKLAITPSARHQVVRAGWEK